MIFKIIKRKKFIIEKGRHTENVVLIVLDGEFELLLDNKKYILEKNSVLFLEREVFFERHILSPLTLIYIQFVDKPDLTSGIIEFKDLQRQSGTVQLLIKSIENENNELSVHFLEDLFTQAYAETKFKSIHLYSKETASFMEYVEKNYRNKISINDFSKNIFMTHTGFLLKFKKEIGLTPVQYVNNYRLKIASDLLFNTELSIGEISAMCGFENMYYFSNAFKKSFKVSPSSYRKNNL